MNWLLNEQKLMEVALEKASKSLPIDVPVGAIVVNPQGRLIGEGFNQRERTNLIDGHAEMIAMRAACKTLNNWRLEGCVLYVTLEPCLMCSGAIIQSRLSKVVFGAYSQDGSGLDSVKNHSVQVIGGILQEQCEGLLKKFFSERRTH
jgi:tRNA(adenine34) deaminase